MDYKNLYIFVEGNDDERFFQEILMPFFKRKYNEVKIIKYARKRKKFDYIKNFIRSILSMGSSYILVVDIDNSPCITAKKQEIQNKLQNIDKKRILIVIKEIESWYLAGIDVNAARKLGMRSIPNSTDNITKEDFNSLIPSKFSRIDFMKEILKNFSIQTAIQKNNSLKYCIEKYDC